MIKPAEARAMAPVVRFAKLDNCGRDDEERAVFAGTDTIPVEARRLERKTCWRSALRVEK